MNRDEAVATLITYRMEQAHKAVEDALCLLTNNGSARSIINRAYYAMFYAVLALLLLEGKSYTKHAGVISAFDKFYVHAGLFSKALSADLHRMFELRQEHDYKIVDTVDTADVREAVDTAQRFVDAIAHFFRGRRP